MNNIHQSTLTLLISFVAFSFWTNPSFAGGSYWKSKIEELEIYSSTQALVTLSNEGVSYNISYPDCQVMQVNIKYQPESKGNQTWSKDLVNKSKHSEALEYLVKAQETGDYIFFGEIGTGLVPNYKYNFTSWIASLLSIFDKFIDKSNLQEEKKLVVNKQCSFKTHGITMFEEVNKRKNEKVILSFHGPI